MMAGHTLSRRSVLLAPVAYGSHRWTAEATTVEGYCATPLDLEFLALINQYRADHGLASLRLSQTLGAAAEHKAVDMGETGYLEHGFQDGTTWYENIVNHGYPFSGRGENIAWGYWTAEQVFAAWKSSPSHDENMLGSNYRAIGIAMRVGYVYGPEYPFWATEFGSTFDTAGVTCGQPTPTMQPTATVAPAMTPTSTPSVTATPDPTATERVKKCRGRGNPDCQPGVSGKAARGR